MTSSSTLDGVLIYARDGADYEILRELSSADKAQLLKIVDTCGWLHTISLAHFGWDTVFEVHSEEHPDLQGAVFVDGKYLLASWTEGLCFLTEEEQSFMRRVGSRSD